MDALDSPDIYEDINVAGGCDLEWSFQLSPWNGTGTSATFNVYDLAGAVHTFALNITVSALDDNSITTFALHLTPGQLAAIGLVSGVTVAYFCRETMTDGSIWAIGNGMVLVS